MPGGSISTERRTGELMKSPFTFKKYGQCGMDVSDLWPHLSEVADDICWVRSVYTEIPNHEPSCLMLNTGANQAGRPSMGAWLTYGLGTENQNLPGYVVLCPDIPTTVGPPLWSNGFLPAINQGTYISNKVSTVGPDGMPLDMPEEMREKAEKDKDGKEKLKKVVVEKNFDPKKILNYVNNPKFTLVEQRRELDLLQQAGENPRGRGWQRPAGGSRHPVHGSRIPDADRSSRGFRHPQRVAGDARSLRTRRCRARRSHGCSAGGKRRPHGAALLFEGRPVGRARGYLGPQGECQEFRPGFRGCDQGSQEPRAVERHAGGLRI